MQALPWFGDSSTRAMTIRLGAVSGLSIVAGAALVVLATPQMADKPYSAAFVKETVLTLFPFNGQEVMKPLPFKVSALAYSQNGKSIYTGGAFTDGSPRALYRIDIRSGQSAELPGSVGLRENSLAVSRTEDKILVSGRYTHEAVTDCGVFELRPSSGKVKKVLGTQPDDCRYERGWQDITFSPEGTRAVALHGNQLGMIDLSDGEVQFFGRAARAAWSPDGKWIAVVAYSDEQSVFLLDSTDLSKRRQIGHTDIPRIDWSPDSRYLLVWKSELFCGPYYATLEALDVNSGQRTRIGSSVCKVNLMTTGWVSNEVLR